MGGVVTVTAAPSIDRSYFVDELTPGSVHRAHTVTEEFAGKGVNVSHGLSLAKVPTLAVVPLPKEEVARRQAEKPWLRASTASATPRVSITVLEPDGSTTKINQHPPALTPEDWDALVGATRDAIAELSPQWVAVCGALPSLTTGDDLNIPALADLAHDSSALFAVDTSGPLLTRWAKRGVPDLIKPNADELAECVGRALVTFGDVVRAATEVRDWGVDRVVVSLGPDGMIGVFADQIVHAVAPPQVVRNTIGAGDASLAGLLAHLVSYPEDFVGAVANAVAWGSAKVGQPTSQLSTVTDLPSVQVSQDLNLDQKLSDIGLPERELPPKN
jgi:1-phosphofructokinase